MQGITREIMEDLMNFFERVTGSDITKAMKDFDTRVKNLPIDYQITWTEIQNHLEPYGDFTGRNLIPILNQALELLELTSADGKTIEEVFNHDIKSFCIALATNEGAKTYRDKLREQLNYNVRKKLGELK